MSMELLVGLPAGATIDGAAVAAAAERLGLELAFDQDFSLDDVGGFQPGKLAGLQAGIEIEVSDRPDVEVLEYFGPHADRLARIVTFYWGASFAEGAFANALAAVLVSSCGGICFDPEGGELLSLDQLTEGARAMVAEARKQPAD